MRSKINRTGGYVFGPGGQLVAPGAHITGPHQRLINPNQPNPKKGEAGDQAVLGVTDAPPATPEAAEAAARGAEIAASVAQSLAEGLSRQGVDTSTPYVQDLVKQAGHLHVALDDLVNAAHAAADKALADVVEVIEPEAGTGPAAEVASAGAETGAPQEQGADGGPNVVAIEKPPAADIQQPQTNGEGTVPDLTPGGGQQTEAPAGEKVETTPAAPAAGKNATRAKR